MSDSGDENGALSPVSQATSPVLSDSADEDDVIKILEDSNLGQTSEQSSHTNIQALLGRSDNTQPKPLKRTFIQCTTNTPPASPEKKRVNTGAVDKKQMKSATHSALEVFKRGGKQAGILNFFQKATPEEVEEQNAREFERLRDEENWNRKRKEGEQARELAKSREKERIKKQNQRAKQKLEEIKSGQRSPGGTKVQKQKVCADLSLSNKKQHYSSLICSCNLLT